MKTCGKTKPAASGTYMHVREWAEVHAKYVDENAFG